MGLLIPFVVTDPGLYSVFNTKAVEPANEHISSVSNPHSVTKTQVGLSNADNTSDLNKPLSTAQKNQNRKMRLGGII